MTLSNNSILRVENLVKYFPLKGKKDVVRAVDGVTFGVDEGKTFGVVGESGCGKTTLARVALRLEEPTSGSVFFKDTDVTKLKRKDLRMVRRNMQIVFQDPFSALNPRSKLIEIVKRPLILHKIVSNKDEANARAMELLSLVNIPLEKANRYPHELSGGMRQRACLARSLASNPSVIFLDEPTSALDVSVQAKILNLLGDLQNKLKLTYILISHNIPVVKFISHTIAVMYLGKFVEIASADILVDRHVHPYTEALISAVPSVDPKLKSASKPPIGEPPSRITSIDKCRFCARCSYAVDVCKKKEPPLIEIEQDHYVACFLHSK